MANLVSGWTADDGVYLVQREGDDVVTRRVAAPWTLFVHGLDDSDRATLARDRRVRGCRAEGAYTRIDCRNRWARKEVVEALTKAARRAPHLRILEADVSPLRRVLSDVGSLQIHPEPRVGYFDLEVDSRRSFDEMRTGRARLLSWALCDDVGRTWKGLLEDDTDAAEVALWRRFLRAIQRFDVLVAWSGTWSGQSFDFAVLETRCAELRIDVHWPRWCFLDHLEVFRKYNMHSDDSGEAKQSFKLNHVAGYLLGEGKHDFDAARTWEAWQAGGEERARLLSYNVQDTRLLPRIEAKTGFLALHLAVCHVTRCFPDTRSLNATAQGDGFLCRLGTEHGYRWPSRRERDDAPAPFKGAYVMEPTRLGAIDDVHVCDFSGLYPSIMRTWNMSLDTKLPPPRGWKMSYGGVEPVVRDGVCQLPGRPTWFRTDRDGMFRIALDELVAKRGEYTAEMKRHPAGSPEHERFKRLSGAFKIVANSFYGICGSPWSRFFDVEIAEGVTQTGRWLLENVISEAKLRELDPIYGDTDSVFIQGRSEEMRGLVDAMNASWSERLAPWGITKHHVDLDFEKTFRRIVIVSAKRYAGRYRMYKGRKARADAKPEVKGLEYKRGDTIRLAREMQEEVVGLLLSPEELPAPAEVRGVIDRWRHRLLHGDLDFEDVVISQALSKPAEQYEDPVPAHARVALLLKERGERIEEGARVRYLMVHGAKKAEAVPASDPDALERVDRNYYWERRVYPATERVLTHVYPGVSWGESRQVRKQRVQEQNGQTALDFEAEGRCLTGKTNGAEPRMRRRRRKQRTVHVTLLEHNTAEDGGAEKFRRLRLLEAVKAAIEAHPGQLPVTIRIVIRDPIRGEDGGVKVLLPTGLGIEPTPAARRALERVVGPPGSVDGFPD